MTRDLLAAAREGDPVASEAWDKSNRALAAGIVSLINVLDPSVIILGGGIMAAADDLMLPLLACMDRMEWRLDGCRVPLVAAQLGEMAGSLGVAAAALGFTPGQESSPVPP